MRAVSVLKVDNVGLWSELHSRLPTLEEHLGEALDPLQRVVAPTFEAAMLPALRDSGVPVMVRYARRTAAQVQAARSDLQARVDALPSRERRVLHAAQRHALDGVVIGLHAWDPEHDAASVRALFGAGLLSAVPDDDLPQFVGRYRLVADLPAAPPVVYDFEDAVMDETDDLSEARPGPVDLLHDLACLAGALLKVRPKRTRTGDLAVVDVRRLGRQLGVAALEADGRLSDHPRWVRALQALEALDALSTEPLSREVFLDLGLERVLEGDTAEAVDRFVHRLVERSLHVVVPAVREALRQAGGGAVDEMIFLECLHDQHRDLLFPRWQRAEGEVYPHLPGERVRAWDETGWQRVESRMIGVVLKRMDTLGLIRRAPGVFAGTTDGRVWAGAETWATPPVWVSSDLEVMVPPHAVTPWERFQLERLGRCLGRDVVDRYRLERDGLGGWLATHALDEALALLARRAPGVPEAVVQTLTGWAESLQRVVLTRGVLLQDG